MRKALEASGGCAPSANDVSPAELSSVGIGNEKKVSMPSGAAGSGDSSSPADVILLEGPKVRDFVVSRCRTRTHGALEASLLCFALL